MIETRYLCDYLSPLEVLQQGYIERGRVLLWHAGRQVTQTSYWLAPPPAQIVIDAVAQGLCLRDGALLLPPMFEEIVATYYDTDGASFSGARACYHSLVFRQGDKYGLASATAYLRGREDKIVLLPAVYDDIQQLPWSDRCYMVRKRDRWSIYSLRRDMYLDETFIPFDMAQELCPLPYTPPHSPILAPLSCHL